MANQLIDKVQENDERGVKEALCSGMEVNARDNDGLTALHHAVDVQNLGIVRLLLVAGAEVNVQDNSGNTPLHQSLTRDYNFLVTRCLLKSGADPNIANKEGKVPLHKAAHNLDVTGAELLLEYGARTEIEDQYGQTADFLARNCNDTKMKNTLSASTQLGWRLNAHDCVSRIQKIGNHELTEIYNFCSQERVTICSNTVSNTDVMQITKFSEITHDAISEAADQLVICGGKDFKYGRVQKPKVKIN